jgi:hypothetical protein
VAKGIRESVVFAVQNLTVDPPFSKLDLVSCRNVLISLEPEMQEKLLSVFHFALNRGLSVSRQRRGRRSARRAVHADLEAPPHFPAPRARYTSGS